MKRKIIDDLIKWKDNKKHKPLLISGVRQCGKTYILKEFGNQYFEDLAYFNFDENTLLQSLFDVDFDVKRIVRELGSIFHDKEIIPNKTLVVFDEIQAFPRAISSLKYFCENMPELHLIAAGSLLGVALKKEGISFPIGKIDRLDMYPMSFEEFVIANGGKKYIQGLNNLKINQEVPQVYKVALEKYLKDYYIVGGMPEVVENYIENHDYNQVDRIQRNILLDYQADFSKHTDGVTTNKISLVWDSIPNQIAKENNKFVFSHVKSGMRSKDLEDALQWLVNAGLVYKLNLVEYPETPLSGMCDYTYFKVYMSDVGLLRNKLGLDFKTILGECNDAPFIRFKGALTENYVLCEFKQLSIDTYFWRSNSDAEIDFITDYKGILTPIEVKSADNTKAKSLSNFIVKYKPAKAFKVSLKNVGITLINSTNVSSLPLYLMYKFKEHY